MTNRTTTYDYDTSRWIQETGWPTHKQDITEAVSIYTEWKEISPRCPFTGALDDDQLIEMIIKKMKQLHPHSDKDAYVISSILIIQAASFARREGVSVKAYTS